MAALETCADAQAGGRHFQHCFVSRIGNVFHTRHRRATMSAADAVSETQNQAASETSASSGIDGSSAGPLTGADEPQHADSDALTAVQLAALASKALHGGPDQASDALVARYDNNLTIISTSVLSFLPISFHFVH